MKKEFKKRLSILSALICFFANSALADGVAGITQATTMITGYFEPAVKLMYAIGAICGLIGGVQLYMKFIKGDPEAGSRAGAWFGGCVALVVVGTVLKSFFQ